MVGLPRRSSLGRDFGRDPRQHLLFPENPADPESSIAVFSTAWLPRAAIDARRHPVYAQWEQDGTVTVVEGETTDFAAIEAWAIEAAQRFDVRCIGYDPWNLAQLSQRCAMSTRCRWSSTARPR